MCLSLIRPNRALFGKQSCNNLIKNVNHYSDKVQLKVDQPFKLHKLKEGPEMSDSIEKPEVLKIYKDMKVIRLMETKCADLYRSKIIRGFLHLYPGQEAIAVGMRSILAPTDLVITAYRCHGWCYMDMHGVKQIVAELAGRVTGLSRGKGGSMHLYTKTFLGGNGIVGAQVPVGTGAALALKYQNKKNVCVILYGDGAANQGQVFESYNIAKLWSLPAVFVCENNEYAMGTSTKRGSSNTNYYTRGDYIPGIWIDGMDVCATRAATKFAKKWCNSGKGPLVLEMHTYRYFGHSMSDPGYSYRSREEIKRVREERDPIKKYAEKIIENKLVTAEEIKKLDGEAKMLVDNAVKAALKDKVPPADEVAADINVKNLRKKVRTPVLWNKWAVKNLGKPVNPK